MAKKIITGLIILITILLIFFFFRFLYVKSWLSNITINYELVPIDVISLIITTLITVLIAWYITKKLTAQRYEKEFIISDLKNIEDQISNIENITNCSESINLQTILDLCNKLQNQINRFNKTVEILNISCKDSKKLNKYYLKLYKKATNVDGLMLDIDSSKKIEINQLCTNFILTTRSIICSINKR